MKKYLSSIVLGIIVLGAIFLRTYKLNQVPPSLDWDEASFSYNAYTIANWGKDEWGKSGKKALMFVMTEDTEAADQIANRLNTDPQYKELNGKTINLHTNLKGTLRKRGKRESTYYEFVENEKEISDEDLEFYAHVENEFVDKMEKKYPKEEFKLMIRIVEYFKKEWEKGNYNYLFSLDKFFQSE